MGDCSLCDVCTKLITLVVFGLLVGVSMLCGGYVVKLLLYLYGNTDGRSIDELDVLDDDFWVYNAWYSFYFTLAWTAPLLAVILGTFIFCQTMGIAFRICLFTMCGGDSCCSGGGRRGDGGNTPIIYVPTATHAGPGGGEYHQQHHHAHHHRSAHGLHSQWGIGDGDTVLYKTDDGEYVTDGGDHVVPMVSMAGSWGGSGDDVLNV